MTAGKNSGSKRKRRAAAVVDEGEENATIKRAKRKKYRKNCSADGCTNQVVNGGVCRRHGAQRKGKPLCRSIYRIHKLL